MERGQKEWGNRRRKQNSGKGTGVERGAERVGEEEGEEQDRGKKLGLEVKIQTSWNHCDS